MPFAPVSEYSIHNLAAVLVFATGLSYCAIQTYMSYYMMEFGIGTRIMCHWRLAFTVSVVANFIVFVIGSVISNVKFDRAQMKLVPELKLRWRPDEPGYRMHVISNVAEWLMCFSFCWFSLTFIREFNRIRITSDFVEDHDRESLRNMSTDDLSSSIENSVPVNIDKSTSQDIEKNRDIQSYTKLDSDGKITLKSDMPKWIHKKKTQDEIHDKTTRGELSKSADGDDFVNSSVQNSALVNATAHDRDETKFNTSKDLETKTDRTFESSSVNDLSQNDSRYQTPTSPIEIDNEGNHQIEDKEDINSKIKKDAEKAKTTENRNTDSEESDRSGQKLDPKS